MAFKQKRKLRNARNRYLKPGALAQLRYNRSTTRSCTDVGNTRVVMLGSKVENDVLLQTNSVNRSLMSPERTSLCPMIGTPKTPRIANCGSESLLESLPMDILVKIICYLHHDQLRAVFHVSQKIRMAVLVARKCHFNYTTPDRSRQEMLRTMTPLPTEHWPFLRRDRKGFGGPTPRTPKAPRHGPRPPSRLNMMEMREVSAVLFQESTFPLRCMVLPSLPKPPCKSLASNRVLFYEDELCQAVAQNKLR
ncbi:F-box protein At4g35930-like [Tasmannia lanceolata]|uniref:F-box protein At4g35930-like n=1 Tax=Tasmannia lanceolata TaxID=3420 RepID=UPI0040644BDA